MLARRLSQFFALALAVLTYWVVISLPGVVDPEFAGTIYIAFGLVVSALFALLFVALRLGSAGSTIYWSGGSRPDQAGRIAILIVVALAIHFIAGSALVLQGRLDEGSLTLGLLVWTLVPATFLALRIVKWPQRLQRTSTIRLLLTGTAAIGLAAMVSHLKFSNGPADFELPSLGILALSGVNIIVLAAAEEIVFRVLLLTALLDLTRSRFQAVFLSGIAFGLTHAPLALAQQIVQGDWPLLQLAAQSYAGHFLMQTLLGLGLGVLWLRTGSIALVVLTHVIFNIGPYVLTGLSL